MNTDLELDLWRSEWQSESQSKAPVPADLRAKVDRQTRLMRLTLLGDVLVTITMGGATTAWAVLSPVPDVILLAAMTWIFIAAAWVFSLFIKRGKWSANATDTRAFLDLCIARCRATIACLWFGAGLMAVELGFCLPWVYQHVPGRRDPFVYWLFGSLPLILVWACVLMVSILLIWYGRRKRAELESLLQLRDEDRS